MDLRRSSETESRRELMLYELQNENRLQMIIMPVMTRALLTVICWS